jgi:hypothetical protein
LGKLFSTGWHRKPRGHAGAGGEGDGLKLHEVTDQKPLAPEKKAGAADELKKQAS